ncbi:cytochrome c biogenesis protein ResB [Thermocrinis jamiesonii]|jgi:ResB protein required for cytochrome c biosynthesis|uniref:cytochrome c biogenesis protein ResB n=1 Tax=Thermocrinis jamiesonii TaxID=1302351 RepID=UPI000495DEDE|nr:cytochrome c biogenesis protein ResB [Thermocrinis jamiesonii]
MLRGFAFFIISSIIFFAVAIVGLFHLKERGTIYFLLLALTGFFFTIALANFLLDTVKGLYEEYKKYRKLSTFIFEFFASLKLAIFLMIAIGVLSMLGSTYIQQGRPYEFYVQQHGPEIASWIWKLWLNDVFHSWYYILFIVLLAINLILCSYKRLPSVWKHTFSKERFQRLDEHLEKHLKPVEVVINPDKNKVIKFLQSKGFKVFVEEEGGRIYFYGEKGKYSRLGVYVVHIALLIIMAGALIDGVFGKRGTVVVAEGSREDIMRSLDGQKSYRLPFQIKLETFHIVSYEEEAKRKGKEFRGDPKVKDAIASFESKIQIIEGGKVVKEGLVAVNAPFEHGPYRIFQATYGLTGEAGWVKLSVFDRNILPEDPKRAFLGEVEIKAGQVVEFKDMLLSIDRSVLNLEDEKAGFEGDLKPALIIKVLKDGKDYNVPVIYSPELTVFAFTQMPELIDFPYIFFMEGFRPRFFSGLQISYSPGTPIIWTGSTLLVLGLILAFYTIHRKVWARLEGNTLKISFWSHKLKEEFRKTFLKSLEELGDVKEASGER